MLKHKKVSGQPNVDGAHIGGADWDEFHITPQGGMYQLGKIHAHINGSTCTKQWLAGSITAITRTAAGTLRITCGIHNDDLSYVVDSSGNMDVFAEINARPRGTQPSGSYWYVDSIDKTNRFIYLKHTDGGSVGDPGVQYDLTVTVVVYPNFPV